MYLHSRNRFVLYHCFVVCSIFPPKNQWCCCHHAHSLPAANPKEKRFKQQIFLYSRGILKSAGERSLPEQVAKQGVYCSSEPGLNIILMNMLPVSPLTPAQKHRYAWANMQVHHRNVSTERGIHHDQCHYQCAREVCPTAPLVSHTRHHSR